MDPTTTFCPNVACPARGQIGQGHSGIHARKDRRYFCTQCCQTFSATTGTVFYRLHPSAAPAVIVVIWLAHEGPRHASVAAFGLDERTGAAWWARSGRQGQAVHESVVEPPQDLGQGQADARRVK